MIGIYRKKEMMAIMLIVISVGLSVGCSMVTEKEVSETVSSVNTVEVTGYVVSAYGNEITLQLVDTSMQGASGEMSNRGMAEGEMPEGGMPEISEGERPELGEGEDSQASGDRTQMSGDRTQMSGDRTQMGEGMQSGMQSQMMQGMPGMLDSEGGTTVDLEDLYPLSDEVVEYLVPVKTPVMQYGTEFTFSQISAEMYITIIMDENENIISIEVL